MPDSVKNNLYLQLLPSAVELQPREFYNSESQLVATQVTGRGIGQPRQNMIFFDFRFSLPLVLLLLLAVFFLVFRKNLTNFMNFLLNFKRIWSSRRVVGWSSTSSFLLSFLFSIFSLSLFFAEAAHAFVPAFAEGKSFVLLFFSTCIAAFLFLLFRFFTCWLIGAVTNEKPLFFGIQYAQLIFFTLMSIAIIPVIFIGNFCGKILTMHIFTSLCFILLGILLLYFFRTIRLFMQEKCSIFFWFLYFCTIEILPITIAIKILEGTQ
jgi:hypothetical protein